MRSATASRCASSTPSRLDTCGPYAGALRAGGVQPGDRVILSLSDPHDFLAAFVGVLIAGASAVPLPTTGELGAPRSFATRVRAVCTDCGPTLAVVEDSERFRAAMTPLPSGLLVREPRDLAAADGVAPLPLRDAPPDATAVIQYTSGSTGTPKGVIVTHANLLANCRAIRDATGYTRVDRMVAWLPLHHDMGLVGGLLTSIYCAAETWLMPPMTFLARPVVWLEAITQFRATLTVGPTFGYALCARRIPDKQLAHVSLSSLRLAYIGAEPIGRDTVQAFTDRFAAYGLSPVVLYPVYGLAEATLAVTFPRPGTPIRYETVDRVLLARTGAAVPVDPAHVDAVTFVSVGHPLPGLEVEILAPETGERLPERQVGELVVAGASVSPGYYAAVSEPPRVRLHTGDLAYVADGHFYVVDRIKDLVIIAGQNYSPSDIERAAAEVVGVRRGRLVAFALPGEHGTEALHIVAEASPDAWRLPAELAAEIKQAVRTAIGLTVTSVLIVAPGALERTSSGKIKRRACIEAYRAATLEGIAGWADILRFKLDRWWAQWGYRGRIMARPLRPE
jgi:fatty-acyl-CoA synthase